MMIAYGSLESLVASVATRVRPAVPAGFRLDAQECTVSVFAPGDCEPRAIDLSPLLETGESVSPVEAAALRILSDLQDEVVESLAAAWPRDATHAGPASPYATASARLDLGYRYADDPDNPVLAFEPVPLDDIETGP